MIRGTRKQQSERTCICTGIFKGTCVFLNVKGAAVIFELISDNLIRFRTGYRTIYRTWRGDKIVPRCEEQLRDEQNDLSLTCHPIK